MKLRMDLQLFAHRKTGGGKNGRDSNPKYLGVKKGDGSFVIPGNIILKQRGTKIFPGENVGMGKDYTIYAMQEGNVSFKKKRNRKYVHVVEKQ